MEYNFKEIEKKWQAYWADHQGGFQPAERVEPDFKVVQVGLGAHEGDFGTAGHRLHLGEVAGKKVNQFVVDAVDVDGVNFLKKYSFVH